MAYFWGTNKNATSNFGTQRSWAFLRLVTCFLYIWLCICACSPWIIAQVLSKSLRKEIPTPSVISAQTAQSSVYFVQVAVPSLERWFSGRASQSASPSQSRCSGPDTAWCLLEPVLLAVHFCMLVPGPISCFYSSHWWLSSASCLCVSHRFLLLEPFVFFRTTSVWKRTEPYFWCDGPRGQLALLRTGRKFLLPIKQTIPLGFDLVL